MTRNRPPLSDREKRLYARLLALTRPHWLRLAAAILCGLLYGGSLSGLLLAGKSGLSQTFGGRVTALQQQGRAWIESVYAGSADHAWLLTLLLLTLLVFLMFLRGLSFFFSKYLI